MHLHPASALSLGLFSTAALAQSGNQITWSAVTYTYHGEKVPSWLATPDDLTPLGAQQLYDAGQGVRNLYLTSLNISQNTRHVYGLSVNAIENQQLSVLATDESYVATSATAFMQGLYPPFEGSTPFPLNGYQYPNIGTVSLYDFNYVWIAGNVGCTNYQISQVKSYSSEAYTRKIEDTLDYYQSLHERVFPDVDMGALNYRNAYDIYEAALYAYKHNQSIQDSTSFTTEDLRILRNLASEQQWSLNTPNGTDTINAIAGTTLSSRVLQQFAHSIASAGLSDKLTLLFGSYEPMLAFFALSGLSTGASASKFMALPDHGSTLTFELFSYDDGTSAGQNASIPMPYSDDLYVRFLFRNGTDPASPFTSYSLFDLGNSKDVMTWQEFVLGMSGIGLDGVAEWCDSCGSRTLFCPAFNRSSSNERSSGSLHAASNDLSPTLGGVIGAIVALVAVLLAVAGLLLAGFRLEREGDRKKRAAKPDFGTGDVAVSTRSGTGGNAGFRGADRLPSDPDLAIKCAGATVVRHERVGSWELKNSPSRERAHGSLDKEFESGHGDGRLVSMADYGRRSEELDREHIDSLGDPVKPVESV